MQAFDHLVAAFDLMSKRRRRSSVLLQRRAVDRVAARASMGTTTKKVRPTGRARVAVSR